MNLEYKSCYLSHCNGVALTLISSLLFVLALTLAFDIFYISNISDSDDNNLEISGYTLVRSDHPSHNKRGGVCIHYKSFLPLRILNVQYL